MIPHLPKEATISAIIARVRRGRCADVHVHVGDGGGGGGVVVEVAAAALVAVQCVEQRARKRFF